MKKKPHKEARKIRALVDNACSIAKNYGVGGAINWADLGCSHVATREGDDGSVVYRVYVEEASPEAVELKEFIEDHLETQGHTVDVVTEW